MIIAKVVTLNPPPVEPGAEPINISIIVNIFEKLPAVATGEAVNPAERADTDAKKEVVTRSEKV